MITEQQQEQAALYALGVIEGEEQAQFADEMRASAELRDFVRSLQRVADQVVLAGPWSAPPQGLREKVLRRIQGSTQNPSALPVPGLHFLSGNETVGWKRLPVPGAWIKLLSFEPARGYAVLMGKLEPGARYPAHTNVGPEDFYILSGDLHVGERTMGPGDFHHADAGSVHAENHSVEGCTLLAVLTVDDPLVSFARA